MAMTVEEMRNRKRQLGYSYEKIAQLSGVPLSTVQKILGGATKAPRYSTLQQLERIFLIAGEEKKPSYGYAGMIREESVYHTGKEQGDYTLEDYYGMPEEKRAELIDGVIYDMSAPSSLHQAIAARVWKQIDDYIEKEKGTCIPLFAPVDVQLDRDDRTMVQPDVLVVCDRGKFRGGVVYGAPDFVVEILSASTRRKDAYLKLSKYQSAGVREYWIVDPEKKKVIVYDLANDEIPVICGFEDKIPVRILDGRCTIDFAVIYEYVQFLYEES